MSSSVDTESASPVSCSFPPPPALLSPSRPSSSSRSKSKQTLTHSQLPSSSASFPETELNPKSFVIPISVSKNNQSSAALRQILSDFRVHFQGRWLGEWTKHSLCLEQYQELCQSLAEDPKLGAYVEDKVRYDYVPHASELIIRMASTTHDEFTHLVVLEIERQIEVAVAKFSKSSSTLKLSQFLQNVKNRGTRRVVALDKNHKRSPDASFSCSEAQYPALVIETAYTQGRKDLRHVAHDYVVNMSDGNVKMVIGLEIGYGAKKPLIDKVSVWGPKLKNGKKPELTSECIFNQPFRNSNDPSMASNEILIIPVGAFAPKVMLDNYGIVKEQHSRPVVSIPMTTLACFLDQAQREHEFEQENRGYKDVLPFQTVRRSLSSSSEEDLREEDLKREKHREKRIAEKTEREDGDWEP